MSRSGPTDREPEGFDLWLSEELRQLGEEDRQNEPPIDLRPALRRRLTREGLGDARSRFRPALLAVVTVVVAFAAGVTVNRWTAGVPAQFGKVSSASDSPASPDLAPSAPVRVRQPSASGAVGRRPVRAGVPVSSRSEPLARLRSEMGQLDRQLAELRALRTQEEPLVRISSQDGVDYVLPVSDLLQLMEARAQRPSRGAW